MNISYEASKAIEDIFSLEESASNLRPLESYWHKVLYLIQICEKVCEQIKHPNDKILKAFHSLMNHRVKNCYLKMQRLLFAFDCYLPTLLIKANLKRIGVMGKLVKG